MKYNHIMYALALGFFLGCRATETQVLLEIMPSHACSTPAPAYPLLLPSTEGLQGQVLGLANSTGTLTWLTTLTNSNQLNLIYTATSGDIPLTLVLRDTTGSFAATNITATGLFIGNVSYTLPATNAVQTTVQAKLNNTVSITDFGGIGDGVTNSYTALRNALIALNAVGGGELFIPAGTYILSFTPGTTVPLFSNITITGQGSGNTTLIFEPTNGSFAAYFATQGNPNTNVTIRDLAIVSIAPSDNQFLFFFSLSTNINNFTLDNVLINGNMTNSGTTEASLSTLPEVLVFPSGGTQSNITINQCTIHNVDYPILNSGPVSVQDFQVLNSNFFNNYGQDISFNSNSTGEGNILIDGNTITNNLAYRITSRLGIAIGIAGGTDVRIVNNYVSGIMYNAIHIEGSVLNFVIQNNNVEVDGWGAYIGLGGSPLVAPQFGVVSGNTFTLSGNTQLNPLGIALVYSGNPAPAKNIIITDNVVIGNYANGIQSAALLSDIGRISGNDVILSQTGYFIEQGGFYLDHNISTSCGLGLLGIEASVGSHIFNSCAINAIAIGQPLVMQNAIVVLPAQSLSVGTTNYNLFSIDSADRLSANANVYVRAPSSVNDFSAGTTSLLWDGTTLTANSVISLQPGVIVSSFINNSSMLALSVFTSQARSNVAIEVALNGLYILSPG
jgi:hypothetical protein